MTSPPTAALKLLLLGESGAGKSTFINSLANYFRTENFHQALLLAPVCPIPATFSIVDDNFTVRTVRVGGVGGEGADVGSSATKEPKEYFIDADQCELHVIDTPGVGDSRGIEQDKANIKLIFDYIANCDQLDAICFLLQPNLSVLNEFMRYCLTSLITSVHRDLRSNIIFIFTCTRSTFYRPGDTLGLLNRVLDELRDGPEPLDVPCSKLNIFCVDNEGFRYLAACQQGVDVASGDLKKFAISWDISRQNCQALLDYVRGDLIPYKIGPVFSFARELFYDLLDIYVLTTINIQNLKHDHGIVIPMLVMDILDEPQLHCRSCSKTYEMIPHEIKDCNHSEHHRKISHTKVSRKMTKIDKDTFSNLNYEAEYINMVISYLERVLGTNGKMLRKELSKIPDFVIEKSYCNSMFEVQKYCKLKWKMADDVDDLVDILASASFDKFEHGGIVILYTIRELAKKYTVQDYYPKTIQEQPNKTNVVRNAPEINEQQYSHLKVMEKNDIHRNNMAKLVNLYENTESQHDLNPSTELHEIDLDITQLLQKNTQIVNKQTRDVQKKQRRLPESQKNIQQHTTKLGLNTILQNAKKDILNSSHTKRAVDLKNTQFINEDTLLQKIEGALGNSMDISLENVRVIAWIVKEHMEQSERATPVDNKVFAQTSADGLLKSYEKKGIRGNISTTINEGDFKVGHKRDKDTIISNEDRDAISSNQKTHMLNYNDQIYHKDGNMPKGTISTENYEHMRNIKLSKSGDTTRKAMSDRIQKVCAGRIELNMNSGDIKYGLDQSNDLVGYGRNSKFTHLADCSKTSCNKNINAAVEYQDKSHFSDRTGCSNESSTHCVNYDIKGANNEMPDDILEDKRYKKNNSHMFKNCGTTIHAHKIVDNVSTNCEKLQMKCIPLQNIEERTQSIPKKYLSRSNNYVNIHTVNETNLQNAGSQLSGFQVTPVVLSPEQQNLMLEVTKEKSSVSSQTHELGKSCSWSYGTQYQESARRNFNSEHTTWSEKLKSNPKVVQSAYFHDTFKEPVLDTDENYCPCDRQIDENARAATHYKQEAYFIRQHKP